VTAHAIYIPSDSVALQMLIWVQLWAKETTALLERNELNPTRNATSGVRVMKQKSGRSAFLDAAHDSCLEFTENFYPQNEL
jgi:hypothetical protein